MTSFIIPQDDPLDGMRPIVNDDLARHNPRLAAKIQAARLRKRLAQREQLEIGRELVQSWWKANYGVGEE